MKKIGVLILAAAFVLPVLADSDFPSIKKFMDAEQFEQTGLNKLNEDELEALNRWLAGYTAIEAPVLKRTSKTVKKLAKEQRIESHIAGKFNGWKGKTKFTLANGQVWQQRLSGNYYHRTQNPKVAITQNALGFYMMELLDTGKRIGVKRLK